MPVLRHLSPSLTSDLGMTARSKGKKRAGAPYIPRPPNSFMLFRAQREADYKQNLRPGEPKLHQSELSREIGQAWRSLSPVARAAYQDEAARRAAEHKALYPDYVYRPETKEEKVARQKQEKEERAAATVARRAEKGRKRKGPEKPALSTTELSRPGTRDSTSPASATTDGPNTPTTTTSFSPPVSSPYDTRPSTAGPSTFSTTPATVIERYGDLGPTPAASCCTSYASSPSNEFALAPEPAPLPRSDSSKQPSCGAASSGHQYNQQQMSTAVPGSSWQPTYNLHEPTPSFDYWARDLQNFAVPLAPSESNVHNEFWIPSPEDFVMPMPLNVDPSMHLPPPSVNAQLGMMPDLGNGFDDGTDPLSRMFESYKWDSYGSVPSTSSGSGQNDSPLPLSDFATPAAGLSQNEYHCLASSRSTPPVYGDVSRQGKFFQLNLDLSCPPVPTPSPYGSYYNTPVEATDPNMWGFPQQQDSRSRDTAHAPVPPSTGLVRQWAP